jgi:putative cell wall-binding protein
MPTMPRPALIALVVTAIVGVLSIGVATAQAPAAVRVTAADPIAVGIAVSQQIFDDAAGSGTTALHVVLGRDDVFADTLAAGPLLGGGPLLYVPGGADGTLPDVVASEIERVIPPGSPVYLAGGTDAVSQAIEDDLAERGFLTIRAGGEERTTTATAIAAESVRLYGEPEAVLVADAGNWPDAIAGAALAASEGLPIVLTDAQTASPAAIEFLAELPDAEVIVLGGPATITDAVATALGADRRLQGETRVNTAVAIAAEFPEDVIGTAVINGYPEDGWVEGNAAAALLHPLYLIGPDAGGLPDVVAQALQGRTGDLTVVGGTDRISETALTAAEDAR